MLRRIANIGLGFAALLAGCGTGISTDPTSMDPSLPAVRADGGDARGSDADEDHRMVDAGARETDALADVTSRADDADGYGPDRVEGDVVMGDASAVDGLGDVAGDAARDMRTDVSLDSPVDAAFDVSDAPPRDGHLDAADGTRDVADASLDAADASKDATQDNRRDADAHDAFDGCTAACWPDADYYVDASAAPGGNGSRLQPFKTITAAIEAHAASPAIAKKAYVAAGRYDATLGERFPLVLRGLSLEGAGQDRTFIAGSGSYDHSAEGGTFPGLYAVTMVVGERQLLTRVSGLSIRSLSPVPAENYHGVFCDRGNATGEVASPLGLTHLDKVTVGPGHDMGVLVATSTIPSSTGCNMLITASTITGAWRGVFAVGCSSTAYDDPVMLEMGTDDPASGNTISWMTANNEQAMGVWVQDCVPRASFQYNTFRDSVAGVTVDQSDILSPPHTRNHMSFKHNTFERLSIGGLSVFGLALTVDEISDNRFVNITRAVNQHPGISARAASLDLFSVDKVRRNEFIGNDNALEVGFIWNAPPPQVPPADFGTAADPGSNVFRCNSGPEDNGGDLYFWGNAEDPEATWRGTIHLAGNAWDHVPPTVQTVNPPPNGSDIALLFAPHIQLDLARSTLSTAACPSGRVPGQ